MPFYTYKCEICDLESSARRKINERHDPTDCPKCGRDMHLKLTATQIAPVHGAGSGFTKVTQSPPQ